MGTKDDFWEALLSLPYLAAVTPHHQIEVLEENIEPFEFRRADSIGVTGLTDWFTVPIKLPKFIVS